MSIPASGGAKGLTEGLGSEEPFERLKLRMKSNLRITMTWMTKTFHRNAQFFVFFKLLFIIFLFTCNVSVSLHYAHSSPAILIENTGLVVQYASF